MAKKYTTDKGVEIADRIIYDVPQVKQGFSKWWTNEVSIFLQINRAGLKPKLINTPSEALLLPS